MEMGKVIRVCCLFLTILAVVSFMPSTGWALSCAELQSAEHEYAQSDVVFKGTVKKHTGSTYIIQVHHVYKGETGARTVAEDITSEWLNLKEGNTYLVYGNKNGNRIEVSPCGRTGNWDEMKSDLQHFPKVEAVSYHSSDYKEATISHRIKLVGIIGGTSLLIIGVWWVWRRKRR